MIIGLTGPAQSGKDSFYIIAQDYFKKFNIKTKRIALADKLKYDLRFFIKEKFNIDILNISPEDKEKIRDLLVVYGKIKRQESEGKYWTSLIEKDITMELKKHDIIFITDIRYAYYEKDELWWIRNFQNNKLIHISRLDKNNIIIPPRNLEEEINDPILKSNANYKLCWHTSDDIVKRKNEAEEILKNLYEDYKLRKR